MFTGLNDKCIEFNSNLIIFLVSPNLKKLATFFKTTITRKHSFIGLISNRLILFLGFRKNLHSLFDSWSFGHHYGQNMLIQHFFETYTTTNFIRNLNAD